MFTKLKENKKKKDTAKIYRTMMEEMVPQLIDARGFQGVPLINQCIDQLISLDVDLKDIISKFLEDKKENSDYYIYKTFGELYLLKSGNTEILDDVLKEMESNPDHYFDKAHCVSRNMYIEIAKHEEKYLERIKGWAKYTDRPKRGDLFAVHTNKEKLSKIGLIIIGYMTSKASLVFLKGKIDSALEDVWADYSSEVFSALSFRVDNEAVEEARLFLTKVDDIPYGFDCFVRMFARVGNIDGICDVINKDLDEKTNAFKYDTWQAWFSAAVTPLKEAIEEVCSLGLSGVKISGEYAIKTLVRCIPIPGAIQLSKMIGTCLENVGVEALPYLKLAVENPEQVWAIKDIKDIHKEGLWYSYYADEACDPVEICSSVIQNVELRNI